MRAEGGQRRNVGNRRRNDSINSTQSECLPTSDRLHIDSGGETRSVAGDAPPSPSLSYMQLCQSFESIGSFDWSREVESEYNAKHGEEKESHSTNYQERGRSFDATETSQCDSAKEGSLMGDASTFPTFPDAGALIEDYLMVWSTVDVGSNDRNSDSDRSSLRGSIVEEEFDESCEPSSGECTPTEESGDEKHWNNRRMPQIIKSSAGYSGGDDVHKENRGSRLMGRVTIERPRREPNASETVPLSSRTTRILTRNEPRRTYKPPAMRGVFHAAIRKGESGEYQGGVHSRECARIGEKEIALSDL
ncbi:hypothetical protein COOONC_25554 [Cooperia oncophora]